jgi:hypothetical protein
LRTHDRRKLVAPTVAGSRTGIPARRDYVCLDVTEEGNLLSWAASVDCPIDPMLTTAQLRCQTKSREMFRVTQ